jgi:hypothetical protein
VADEHDPAFRMVAQAILGEFADACAADPEVGADYLDARDRWHAATSDEEREVADDAFVDVLERFTDARGVDLTSHEVRALRALRNG